jgi:hypothetical protein
VNLDLLAPLISCHCLCGFTHPSQRGICTEDDLALVEMNPNRYARVVPMCAACRAALYERTGGRQGEPVLTDAGRAVLDVDREV